MSGILNIYLVFWIYIVMYTLLIQILRWIIWFICIEKWCHAAFWVRGHFNHRSVRTLWFSWRFYTVLLLYWIYRATEWPSAWQPVNSPSTLMRTCFVFESVGSYNPFTGWHTQFSSASYFHPVECNAICTWWWMCLKWNCAPHLSLCYHSTVLLSCPHKRPW